jgi:hypothetical protein
MFLEVTLPEQSDAWGIGNFAPWVNPFLFFFSQ